MRIFAIDPGPELSAYVMWDTATHDFISERMGLTNNEDVRLAVYNAGCEWSGIDALVAIETPQSYGIAVGKSMFATCIQIGRFIQVAREGPFTKEQVKLYGRPTIKGQIGGRNDAEIRASLRIRYGEAKKGCQLYGVKRDIWAALALAVALDETNIKLKEW